MAKLRKDIDYRHPKIGTEFPADEDAQFRLLTMLHQHKLEFTTIGSGTILVLIWCYFAAAGVHLSKAQENGVASILALGLAAMSVGITGSFSVEFKRAGFVAKATLGFGIFLAVMYFVARP